MLNHSRFYCSKRWWRWQWCNWNFMTYKAPVRSSSPKYQHPVLLQVRRLPAAQPTVTKQITSNAFSHSSTRRFGWKQQTWSAVRAVQTNVAECRQSRRVSCHYFHSERRSPSPQTFPPNKHKHWRAVTTNNTATQATRQETGLLATCQQPPICYKQQRKSRMYLIVQSRDARSRLKCGQSAVMGTQKRAILVKQVPEAGTAKITHLRSQLLYIAACTRHCSCDSN